MATFHLRFPHAELEAIRFRHKQTAFIMEKVREKAIELGYLQANEDLPANISIQRWSNTSAVNIDVIFPEVP